MCCTVAARVRPVEDDKTTSTAIKETSQSRFIRTYQSPPMVIVTSTSSSGIAGSHLSAAQTVDRVPSDA